MSAIQQLLAAYGAKELVLEYTHTAESISNSSSYTFNSVNIGDAASDRLVVVVATGYTNSSSRLITGIVIDGSGGTLNVATTAFNNGQMNVGIASRIVTTGTSITVQVNLGGNHDRMAIAVYTLKDYDSATPTDTDFSSTTSDTSRTATLDISAGGVAIYGGSVNANVTVSFSSATESLDQQWSGENGTYYAGYKTTGSALTAHAETVSWSGNNIAAIAGVSWR